jgi:hypothetical protein
MRKDPPVLTGPAAAVVAAEVAAALVAAAVVPAAEVAAALVAAAVVAGAVVGVLSPQAASSKLRARLRQASMGNVNFRKFDIKVSSFCQKTPTSSKPICINLYAKLGKG